MKENKYVIILKHPVLCGFVWFLTMQTFYIHGMVGTFKVMDFEKVKILVKMIKFKTSDRY